MGKFDEATNEKMTQNWLGKGSLHQSGFSMIEKYMGDNKCLNSIIDDKIAPTNLKDS